MEEFERVVRQTIPILDNTLSYIYENELEANAQVILKMPDTSPNAGTINDIGWSASEDITIYSTLASDPEDESAIWQEIEEGKEINKTVSALKLVNGATACNVVVRVIYN